ncbi:hypothetical protein [Streptomyces boninensis]|uniref:hypothetical protein n=1 Tax=Streptomyces boninensis TaxID=2039455 RepID=UPI003B212E9D
MSISTQRFAFVLGEAELFQHLRDAVQDLQQLSAAALTVNEDLDGATDGELPAGCCSRPS